MARHSNACRSRTPAPAAPAMIAAPCPRSGSTRTGSWQRQAHARILVAAASIRFAGIGTRRSGKSAGRSTAWFATSNGADMGRSLSLCLTNGSGFAASRWSAQRSKPEGRRDSARVAIGQSGRARGFPALGPPRGLLDSRPAGKEGPMDPTRWPFVPYALPVAQQDPTDRLQDGGGMGE
jgi:hypothetical protein